MRLLVHNYHEQKLRAKAAYQHKTSFIARSGLARYGKKDEASQDLFIACVSFLVLLIAVFADTALKL